MANGTTAPPYTILKMASLYVGDLHPEVTDLDLIHVFSSVAPLVSVRLCRDRDSFESLCYGYVNFFHLSDASRAMAFLNHTELKGKTMRIMWYQTDPFVRKNSNANLYVKNLPPSITSAQLEGMFCKYGIILSCKVAENDYGKSRGFGFVQFESEDSAMAALSALNDSMLEGKRLYVCKFKKKEEREQSLKHEAMPSINSEQSKASKLYVKHLSKLIDDRKLKEIFDPYGKVTSAKVMYHDNGVSKGFGFVCFSTAGEAKQAIKSLNGTPVDGMSLHVALNRNPKQCCRQLQRSQAPYAEQALYASNWKIPSQGYHPLYYDVPPLPFVVSLSQPSLAQLNHYQNFEWCSRGMYSCGLQYSQEKFSKSPTEYITPYVRPKDDKLSVMKQQKLSNVFRKESIPGPAEASCGKSASLGCPFRPSTQGILKKKNVKMLWHRLEKIEPNSGSGKPNTEVLKKEALRLLQEACSGKISDKKEAPKSPPA